MFNSNSALPGGFMTAEKASPELKRKFILRVYVILTCQLIITAGVVCAVRWGNETGTLPVFVQSEPDSMKTDQIETDSVKTFEMTQMAQSVLFASFLVSMVSLMAL